MADDQKKEDLEIKDGGNEPVFVSPMNRNLDNAIKAPETKKEAVIPLPDKEVGDLTVPKELVPLEQTPKSDELLDKKTKEPDENFRALQSKYDKLFTDSEEYRKATEPVLQIYNEFQKDPIGILRKHVPDLADRLMFGGDNATMLAYWQQTELLKQLKEKYPTEVLDDFLFDPKDAYKVGTPSYEWRVATEYKEKEISSSRANAEKLQKQKADEYNGRVEEDKKYIAETYGFKPEEVIELIEEFDSLHDKVAKGEITPDKHPLSIRNIIRGAFFDKFVKMEVNKAIKAIHDQYKAQGIITKFQDTPTDANKIVDSKKPAEDNKPVKKSFSVLEQQMANIQKQK